MDHHCFDHRVSLYLTVGKFNFKLHNKLNSNQNTGKQTKPKQFHSLGEAFDF